MRAWRARRGRNGAGGEQRGGRLGLALSDERAGEDEKRADDALAALAAAPAWMLTGGAFGTFSVTVNLVVPRFIGYASAAAFTLFATLATSLVLDAVGAFGLERRRVHARRQGIIWWIGALPPPLREC